MIPGNEPTSPEQIGFCQGCIPPRNDMELGFASACKTRWYIRLPWEGWEISSQEEVRTEVILLRWWHGWPRRYDHFPSYTRAPIGDRPAVWSCWYWSGAKIPCSSEIRQLWCPSWALILRSLGCNWLLTYQCWCPSWLWFYHCYFWRHSSCQLCRGCRSIGHWVIATGAALVLLLRGSFAEFLMWQKILAQSGVLR